MSCELSQGVLHGYLDGELDAARASEFENHLENCRECMAALDMEESLRASLQRGGLFEKAPAGLRQKIYAELGAPTPSQQVKQVGFWGKAWSSLRFPVLQWGAVATAFVLLAFTVWRFIPASRGGGEYDLMAAQAVDAHLRSLQPGHLTDVLSTDQHTVKPWFAGKVDFAPPVRDFTDAGFPLVGGRIDVVRGRTVAALVYGRRKHLINVFIWPTTRPDEGAHSGSQNGYHWIDWRKSGMEFCAVSDVAPADLEMLQRLTVE